MVEIKWKEPPPRISSEKAAILAELQKHPGRWALVAEGMKASSCGTPWRKLGCKVEVARGNPGENPPLYDVYARWPETRLNADGRVVRPAGTEPNPPASARPAGPGTYDPGLGRAARGVPADGLPVESLRR